MTQVWVNGVADKKIDPLDRGLAYGDGLFATMRVSAGKVPFLSAHLAKLALGAKRLGFSWCASQALTEQLDKLALTQNDACIKLLLSRGVGGRGYAPPNHSQNSEILYLYDFPPNYALWQNEGVSLCLSEIKLAQQPRLAGIKHLNRLEQVLIKSVQLPKDFDDWLVLDSEDNVIESSMANLFFYQGGKRFLHRLSPIAVLLG